LTASTPSTSTSARRPGAINIITKRGSNELHGTGFLFGRSSDYAARPSFAATKPEFDREQLGGSLGGPALKNKLFWFGNVEKTNENSAIGISSPYFPSLTSYKAPFDALSTTVRSDWRMSQSNDGVGSTDGTRSCSVERNLISRWLSAMDNVRRAA
jgi:hypothetical protein